MQKQSCVMVSIKGGVGGGLALSQFFQPVSFKKSDFAFLVVVVVALVQGPKCEIKSQLRNILPQSFLCEFKYKFGTSLFKVFKISN